MAANASSPGAGLPSTGWDNGKGGADDVVFGDETGVVIVAFFVVLQEVNTKMGIKIKPRNVCFIM